MEYSVKVTNKRIIDLLFNIAKEKNIDICENYYKEPNYWAYFTYRLDENQIIGSGNENGNVVSVDEMIDMLEQATNQMKFHLNNNYTAVIDKKRKKVIVGCQEFNFDVIKELAEKLK